MKKHSLFFLLTAFIIIQFSCKKEKELSNKNCNDILDGWKITSVEYPDVQNQNDIFFPTNEIGYSVGNTGTIMKTSNGGSNWEILEQYYSSGSGINQNALTKARLLTVHFIDKMDGFAGGEGEISHINNTRTGAVFLSTVNGGDSWKKKYLDDVEKINDLVFFDQENGLGLFTIKNENNSRQIKLVSTNDGGENWEEVDFPFINIQSSNFILTPSYVMILAIDRYNSTNLISSNNNGIDWEFKSTPPVVCNRAYFIDDEVGYMMCGQLTYQTKDSGGSWAKTESPMNISSFIHFKNTEEGFVINSIYELISGGGESRPVLKSFEVFQTIDGGMNWEKTEIDKECNFIGINHSPSKNIVYSIGTTINKFEVE
ncbi:MAG TPA: hypothetical protein ENJ95_24340 [Bacteroidetes bacterium]|nr:hypothetical protein [Bacteroidota bacterium]